jgi:hypothetical protein
MGIPNFQFFPALNAPSAITQSYPAVLTLFLPVNYVVDQVISVRCPQGFGMSQINNVSAKILVVDPIANTISLDLDTSGFDPFAFPMTWTDVPLTVPAGEIGTLAAATRDNTRRAGYVPV